jgi:hypothetical protein
VQTRDGSIPQARHAHPQAKDPEADARLVSNEQGKDSFLSGRHPVTLIAERNKHRSNVEMHKPLSLSLCRCWEAKPSQGMCAVVDTDLAEGN